MKRTKRYNFIYGLDDCGKLVGYIHAFVVLNFHSDGTYVDWDIDELKLGQGLTLQALCDYMYESDDSIQEILDPIVSEYIEEATAVVLAEIEADEAYNKAVKETENHLRIYNR